MRLLHIIIAVGLLAIFLRPDTQLIDIMLETNLIWSGGAALFLIAVLLGRFSARWPTENNTAKIAVWGAIVTSLLGLVEYTTEWRRTTVLSQNQIVVLHAAAVERVDSYIVTARDGLFHTSVSINDHPAEMLIDTGATLVLLTYETAQDIGIDMAALEFSEPVISAAGELHIAPVTLDKMTVGKITIKNVKAAISPEGQSHSNLLGASFLSHLDSVTFRNERAYLKKRR